MVISAFSLFRQAQKLVEHSQWWQAQGQRLRNLSSRAVLALRLHVMLLEEQTSHHPLPCRFPEDSTPARLLSILAW